MMGSKAYIFDLDGTILDSMEIWANIGIDSLKRRGINIGADYNDAIFSMSLSQSASYTIERFSLSHSAEDLMREWNDSALYAYENTIELKPCAKEYLIFLKSKKAKLGVATSLPSKLYKPALIRHGIYDLFDVFCGADEVSVSKSKPDVFLLCANKLCVSPKECLVFDDILPAIRSVKSVGMTAFGVYDKSSKEDWAQIEKAADRAIHSFCDVALYYEATKTR